jgi:hypothetical protein
MTKVIDYAENMINLKKLINGTERAMLESDWETASRNLIDSVVELRLLKANVELMKDHGGLPYQVNVELQQSEAV